MMRSSSLPKSRHYYSKPRPFLTISIFLLIITIPSSLSSSPQRQQQRPWLNGIPTSLPLVSKTRVSHDTNRYTFSLKTPTTESGPSSSSSNNNEKVDDITLGISTCSCILVSPPNDPSIVRPYTPISKQDERGTFELLVKTYPNGAMGREFEKLKIGDSLNFWQIPKNIKVQYPFGHPKCIIMLAAGTGITPMFQALLRLFGDDDGKHKKSSNQKTKVVLLYGCRTKEDIYLHSEMEEMKRKYPDRLKICYCLSGEKVQHKDQVEKEKLMVFHQGQINKNAILNFCGETIGNRNSGKSCVWVCGPPSFYDDICGPREEEDVTGVLKDLGFKESQVVKF